MFPNLKKRTLVYLAILRMMKMKISLMMTDQTILVSRVISDTKQGRKRKKMRKILCVGILCDIQKWHYTVTRTSIGVILVFGFVCNLEYLSLFEYKDQH